VQQDNARAAKSKQMLDIFSPYQSLFHGFRPARWAEVTELEARMGQWYDLVEEYSLRQLTFHTDKLPAMAGIVREFAKHMGSFYPAGLW
jgi:hypothetical protein